MSAQSPVYGIREYDLATDRQSERDYELIQLPKAKYISMVSVPNAAYLRFGSRTSPRLDLRDYSELEADDAFGTAYLENPPSSGSLKLLFGVTLTSDSGDDVSISSINDAVDVSDRPGRDLGTVDVSDPVNVSSDAARSIGKARVMDSTETLVDPAADSTVQSINTAQGPFSSITTGQETVSKAGTAIQLNGGSSLSVPSGSSVSLSAPAGNTGAVYVGDSAVSASNGYALNPGDSTQTAIDDVSSLYIDADNSGDSITYKVEN